MLALEIHRSGSMEQDLGYTVRQQWLHDLVRRRYWPGLRQLADTIEGRLLPTRRRTRALLRATVIRL